MNFFKIISFGLFFFNDNIVIIPKPVIHLETSTSCSESLDTNTYSYLTGVPDEANFQAISMNFCTHSSDSNLQGNQ